jgi:hypothetical protein
VHRAEGDRGLVVRAPCSPEERAFFDAIQEGLGAGSISDLIRYAVARLAIEEGRGDQVPQSWRVHYPDANRDALLAKLAKSVPAPATRALPKDAEPLRIGPRLPHEPDWRPED